MIRLEMNLRMRIDLGIRRQVERGRELWFRVKSSAKSIAQRLEANVLDRESEVYARLADEDTPLSQADAATFAKWSIAIESMRLEELRKAADLEAKAKSGERR